MGEAISRADPIRVVGPDGTAIGTSSTFTSPQLPTDLDANDRLRVGAMLVDEDEVPLIYVKTGATTGQNTLSTSGEIVIAADANRMHAAITNDDAAIKVYWGTVVGVTSSTGDVIKPGVTIIFDGYLGDICCVGASGTPLVTFRYW